MLLRVGATTWIRERGRPAPPRARSERATGEVVRRAVAPSVHRFGAGAASRDGSVVGSAEPVDLGRSRGAEAAGASQGVAEKFRDASRGRRSLVAGGHPG